MKNRNRNELKFDLHIHTLHSDGICSPEEVVQHAAKILGGIAITDHDTMKAVPIARKIAKKLDIIFIPAMEITTPAGDILALGIEEIPKGDILEILDNIHEQGGIAILAHPFAGHWQISFVDLIDAIKDRFDAIEVFNASSPLEANAEAMKLVKKIGLPGIAASDAHFLEMIGSAFTISSSDDILKAIKKGEIKIGWI